MIKKSRKNFISIFCVICLITLILVIAIMLIFVGANSYNKVKLATDMTFKGDTALNFMVNKIHSFDNGKVSINMSEEGIQYVETFDDSGEYKTLMYVYEGYLYEDLKYSDKSFEAGKGNKIIEADELTLKSDNNIINITIMYDKKEYKASVLLNAGLTDNIDKKEAYDEE